MRRPYTPGGFLPADPRPPSPSAETAAFVAGLPKAELHVHHVGSASPRIVAQLAARHPESQVPEDPAALAEYFTFTDFGHFVRVYLSVVELLTDAEDFRLLTYEIARDMARQQIRYAELTVTPASSTSRGIPLGAFLEAIEDARKAAEAEFGVVLRWIFDIPGPAGEEAAEETLRAAVEHAPDGLVGFGLGGPEAGVPRARFKSYFDRARAAGLRSVPHAGETGGPEEVRAAVDELGAERVGHGIAAARDPLLLAELVDHGVTLEVCPTSNVATRAVPSLATHPLPRLAAAGVPIALGSDDPPMFGTDLNTEYGIAAALCGLDVPGVAALAEQSVRASFLDEPGKRRLLEEIRAHLDAWHPAP
ncbi:adenosine deaminase [Streptomyces sulphureus]|uniref:adenosine deaminase n=1 Tax=Streptomyces sulphureus TaxID=47758 RepID=UPI003CCBA997